MSTRDVEPEQSEWQAQESAFEAERAGRRGEVDPRTAEYRFVVRALREPPVAPIPLDFAAVTAARAQRERRVASERIEVWLERALVGLLLVGGAAAVGWYNGDWLRELSFELSERAVFGIQSVVSWSLAVAACVGMFTVFAPPKRR